MRPCSARCPARSSAPDEPWLSSRPTMSASSSNSRHSAAVWARTASRRRARLVRRCSSWARSKPSEATFAMRSSLDSSNATNTPGSPNSTIPRTRNSVASKVFPHPAGPQTRVGRPRGRPPPVTSSRPLIPVGALGSDLPVFTVEATAAPSTKRVDSSSRAASLSEGPYQACRHQRSRTEAAGGRQVQQYSTQLLTSRIVDGGHRRNPSADPHADLGVRTTDRRREVRERHTQGGFAATVLSPML